MPTKILFDLTKEDLMGVLGTDEFDGRTDSNSDRRYGTELARSRSMHDIMRGLNPGWWRAACAGVAVAFVVAASVFWSAQRDSAENAQRPQAYFEVRAIDPNGRAVAGAVVHRGTEVLGVTDAYGEWRRFLNVELGKPVRLTLTKSGLGATLTAEKELSVPAQLPANGEIELTGSVQLVHPAKFKGLPVRPSGGNERDDRRAQLGADKMSTSPLETNRDYTIVAAADSLAAATPPAPTVSQLSSVALLSEGRSPDLQAVVESLRQRLPELGVRVDAKSSLRLVVRDLTQATSAQVNEPHLFQIEGFYNRGGRTERVFSVLRGGHPRPQQTARDILWAVSVATPVAHVVEKRGAAFYVPNAGPRLWSLTAGRGLSTTAGRPAVVAAEGTGQAPKLKVVANGGELCGPGMVRCFLTTAQVTPNAPSAPATGLQKRTLRILALPSDSSLRVYVSGYEVASRGAGLYDYWMPSSGPAMLTVVRGGRVQQRVRVESLPRARTGEPLLALAAAAVSRR